MIRPNDTLSLAEASAVTDLPSELLQRLMEGPFSPVADRVTLRQLSVIAR